MRYFCTYFDINYLARGLALYDSLLRVAQPFRLFVLCMDEQARETLDELGLEHLTTISLEQFEEGDEALRQAKQNRSLIEYYFTCTASLSLYILNHFPEIELITYLDADLYFYSDPTPVFDELGDGSILIVGHRFSERHQHLEQYGRYNVGLLAFRNDEHGRECLTWWRERCIEWCYDRLEDGKYADQKYLDDWPARFQGVVVLQHKGAGLAPWNIGRYRLHERENRVYVDSDPLIFYHFHYLRIVNPYLYDSGLWRYGATLGSTARNKIYAPYLRTLRVMMRRAQDHSFGNIRTPHSYRSARQLGRLFLYNRPLLLLGPLSVEVQLAPIARPVLKARRVLMRQKR